MLELIIAGCAILTISEYMTIEWMALFVATNAPNVEQLLANAGQKLATYLAYRVQITIAILILGTASMVIAINHENVNDSYYVPKSKRWKWCRRMTSIAWNALQKAGANVERWVHNLQTRNANMQKVRKNEANSF